MTKQPYHPTPNCLANRVILVTGAGDGIGKAVAMAFAEHGATVILVGKTQKKLEKVYDAIINAGFSQPAIMPLNLETATPSSYQTLNTDIMDMFGRLDGLLHNAATLGTVTPIAHYSIEQWYKVMQINLHAPFLMTQALLPALKKSNDASIIFTSSDHVAKPQAYWGAYNVSKSGVQALGLLLASELEENTPIRVNIINPHRVRTSLRATAYPAEKPPANPEPEQVVSRYIYLMSEASKGMTGEGFEAEVSLRCHPSEKGNLLS